MLLLKRYLNHIVFGLSALMIASFFLLAPVLGNQQEEKLNRFLAEQGATPKEKAAYAYALKRPEALKYLPCYCGCAREGHKSNYNCFFREDKDKTPKIDSHGLICPMCVDIALAAERLEKEGVPLPAIREKIDDALKSNPHLVPTPTPKPPR